MAVAIRRFVALVVAELEPGRDARHFHAADLADMAEVGAGVETSRAVRQRLPPVAVLELERMKVDLAPTLVA